MAALELGGENELWRHPPTETIVNDELKEEEEEEEEDEVHLKGRKHMLSQGRRMPISTTSSTTTTTTINTFIINTSSNSSSLLSLDSSKSNPSAGAGAGAGAGDGSLSLPLPQEPDEGGDNNNHHSNGNGNGNTMAHDDDDDPVQPQPQPQEPQPQPQPRDPQPQEEEEEEEDDEYVIKGGGGGGAVAAGLDIDIKEEIRNRTLLFDKLTGADQSTYGFSGMQYTTSCTEESSVFDAQNGITTVTNHQSEENFKTIRLSGFGILPSPQETTFKPPPPSDNGIIIQSSDEDVVPIDDEIVDELTEFDVESVLRKQNTHDLYCPNCNSCITTRVILRKRKRIIQDNHHINKRDKPETIVVTGLDGHNNDHHTVDISSIEETPTVPAPNNNSDDIDRREPELFRCLSCFSFFIPTGFFRDRNDNKDMQNHQHISATKSNWFFSIFASDKGKRAVEQGDAVQVHSEVNFVNQLNSPLLSNDIPPQYKSGNPVTSFAGSALVNTVQSAQDVISKPQQGDAILVHSEVKFNSPLFSSDIVRQHKSGDPVTLVAGSTLVNAIKPSEDAISKPQQGEVSYMVPSAAGSLLVEKPHMDPNYGHASSSQGAPWVVQSSHTGGFEDDAATQLGKEEKFIVAASTLAPILLNKALTNSREITDDAVEINKTEDDVALAVGVEPVKPAISREVQNVIASEETGTVPQIGIQIYAEEQGVEAGEVHGWDILKSIVYGGLTESITSLGVVTSAAGAGAATLNVLALGLANLIGGLFIIGHNLWELKNDHSEGGSIQIEQQVDRYNELLGRRDKFKFHMVVAVLSYLVFGLVPPIVYGFSFRKSGDRDFKLAAVSAASLLCIVLLALGKGHVRKPPKSYIKTLLYYVSIAILASGVSYIVGSLLKKLIESLGWLDSSSVVVTAPFPVLRHSKPAWSSY